MRPAWAVAVAAASLAADRSGKDNAVASRTIPARARRPLPGHAAGRGDATAHRRLRRRRAGPRSAAGAARQRQGLRVRRQPGVAADPGVVGAGEPARAGGGAGCRRVRRRQRGALPGAAVRRPASAGADRRGRIVGALRRHPARTRARTHHPGRDGTAARRRHRDHLPSPLRRDPPPERTRGGWVGAGVVASGGGRYLWALVGGLRVDAWVAKGDSWEGCVAGRRERWRSRTTLVATVPLPDGGIATTGRARYVAVARKHG